MPVVVAIIVIKQAVMARRMPGQGLSREYRVSSYALALLLLRACIEQLV